MHGAVLRGHFLGLLEAAADDGGDRDPVDLGEGVEVLDAEGSCPGEGDAHAYPFVSVGRSTRCPTAVFDPGTW